MTNPELSDLQRRRHHRHQALQRQVAAQRRADDPGQPAVLPRGYDVDFTNPTGSHGLSGRRQHDRQVRDQAERQLRPAVGHHGGRATSTCSRARTRTLTMNGPGNVYGGVNAAGGATRRSATRRWSSSRATASASTTRRCSISACRRASRSAAEHSRLKLMLDLFNVFNVSDGPDLLERQREPGRRRPRRPRSSRRG